MYIWQNWVIIPKFSFINSDRVIPLPGLEFILLLDASNVIQHCPVHHSDFLQRFIVTHIAGPVFVLTQGSLNCGDLLAT